MLESLLESLPCMSDFGQKRTSNFAGDFSRGIGDTSSGERALQLRGGEVNERPRPR